MSGTDPSVPGLYVPPHFAADEAAALEFIRAHPFGLLVSVNEGAPQVSHVPFQLSADGRTLRFHLARANPQSRQEAGRVATAIFSGPHAYVSPRWYAAPNVPTWNYAAVHAEGELHPLPDDGTAALVASLSREYEGPGGLGDFEQSPAYAGLLRAITGFELRITRLTGKFKLSQNRTAADRARVADELARDPRSEVQELAEMMRLLP